MRYKGLLIVSLCLNAVLILSFVGKRIYYASKTTPILTNDSMVTYSYNRIKADAAQVAFYKMLPNATTDIYFLGTSLTQAFPLQEMFENSNIRNRGIGGNTSRAILSRVGEVGEGKPGKVFLELGTNDITGGNDPQSILATLDSICQAIRKSSPSTKIFLQSVLPMGEGNAKYNGLVNDYNSILKDYAELNKMLYINTHDGFLKNGEMDSELTTDGIHLNGKGYFIWKTILQPYVQ